MKIFSGEYYVYDPDRVVPDEPEVYLDVNHRVVDNRPPEKRVKGEVFVEMPFIKGNGDGPIVVTEDWYVKKTKKREAQRAKKRRGLQVEMMELLAKRDRIRHKLGELDPSKKKDAKKIINYNIALRDIQAQLEMLEQQSGVRIEELDHGTKLSRVWNRVKKTCGKWWKDTKRFFKDNRETVSIVGSVVLPILGAAIVKWLVG